MLSRLPEDLNTILEGLSTQYLVENYSPQYMGWSVDVIIGTHRYNLVKEWHQVLIAEFDGKKMNHLWPKKGQTDNMGIEQVAAVINGNIA